MDNICCEAETLFLQLDEAKRCIPAQESVELFTRIEVIGFHLVTASDVTC